MPTWLSASRGNKARTPTRNYKVDKTADTLPVRVAQAEITSLEIAADDEIDCDPYNRTGSHCVNWIRRASDR